MKQLQKKIKSGKLDVKEDDPFELFVASTDIRYCYYAETHKILGQTFGMCILQVVHLFIVLCNVKKNFLNCFSRSCCMLGDVSWGIYFSY